MRQLSSFWQAALHASDAHSTGHAPGFFVTHAVSAAVRARASIATLRESKPAALAVMPMAAARERNGRSGAAAQSSYRRSTSTSADVRNDVRNAGWYAYDWVVRVSDRSGRGNATMPVAPVGRPPSTNSSTGRDGRFAQSPGSGSSPQPCTKRLAAPDVWCVTTIAAVSSLTAIAKGSPGMTELRVFSAGSMPAR